MQAFRFELALRTALLNTTGLPPNISVSVITSRSFDDVINENIEANYSLLFSGFILMFVYVLTVLSGCNRQQHRLWLSLAGLAGVCLGSLASLGLCSAVGLMFTQLHHILPFLMLGIGIDDMFVLVKAWENLSEEEQKEEIPVKLGKTLANAGCAISVTSVTNIVAFGLGATTAIPALRSFCLYAAVGILAIFLVTTTFFAACLALDESRVAEVAELPSAPSWLAAWRGLPARLARSLATRPAKSAVIALGLVLLAVAALGISRLEQRFEERWLVPDGSHLAGWLDARREYFSQAGERGTVYLAGLQPDTEQIHRLQQLVTNLANQTDIVSEVDTWALRLADSYNASAGSPLEQLGEVLPITSIFRFHSSPHYILY